MMKNDKNEKVKGKHYDIAGIGTLRMPKIDMESERERLDRIFDEIAVKMPEEPKKTQKEIDYENRSARVDRLSSQEPSEFIASVDDRIRTIRPVNTSV